MHPKYQEVIKLRKRGKSYREIAKITDVSKSLISQWCKNLKLPLFARKILERKTKATLFQLLVANECKHRKVQVENRKIKMNAAVQIYPFSKYELLLIGAALYWGEGYKRESPRRYHGICFVNSDPNMVRLFLRFLREII